jgi:hypothetical protein
MKGRKGKEEHIIGEWRCDVERGRVEGRKRENNFGNPPGPGEVVRKEQFQTKGSKPKTEVDLRIGRRLLLCLW